MKMMDFITSPLGLICVGVLSSILGTILFKIGAWFYKKASEKIRRKRFIKLLVSTGEMYCSGYTAGYASYKSTFHQIIHVNDFVVKLLHEILIIILISFSAISLLILFREIVYASTIIIAIACVVIAVKYQKVKLYCNTYKIMFDTVFGEEYKKHMMDGMKQHWDKLTKSDAQKEKEERDVAEGD